MVMFNRYVDLPEGKYETNTLPIALKMIMVSAMITMITMTTVMIMMKKEILPYHK